MKHPLKEGTRVHHRAQEWTRGWDEDMRQAHPQWGWATVIRSIPQPDKTFEYEIRYDAPMFETSPLTGSWASYHIDEWDFHWAGERAPSGAPIIPTEDRPVRPDPVPGGGR